MDIRKLRAATRREQMAVKAAELRYVLALRTIFKGLHAAVVRVLLERYALKTNRLDSSDSELDVELALAAFLRQLPTKAAGQFHSMAAKVIRDTKPQVLGIHPSDTGLEAFVAMAREENIQLISKAGRVYVDDVRAVFEDPANYGLSVPAITKLLVERGNVSLQRAELIARDQTLKLAAKVNQIRQQNAGVHEYTWSGVMDVRERATHVANEGKRYLWAVPPEVTGHPGHDVNCRCIALAYVPELDGL